MKVTLDKGIVHVACRGIELLSLRAEFAKRIRALVAFDAGGISFPVSYLAQIDDLLGDAEKDDETRAALERIRLHSAAREMALAWVGDCQQPSLSGEWNEKLEPAQAAAVSAMTVPHLFGLCLFDEQGSGKTVMSIAAFDELRGRGEVDAMIVVCPKSMVSEWKKEVHSFLGSTLKVEVAEGDRRQRFETSQLPFDVLVSNFEGIEPMAVSLVATAATRKYLLVVDESYYLKNSESRRSAMVGRLRPSCSRCFVLCGTPAPNSAHDLINQFDLADLGFTFSGFVRSSDANDDWSTIADLVEKRGVCIRRLKTEILKHVPQKRFHVERVPLSGKQAMLYEKARSELLLDLRNLNNESFKRKLMSYFQRRSVLLQICSSPSAIDPTFTEVPAKYKMLDGLLSDLISQGRKVVVWSFYRRSLDEMMERYLNYGPVRIDGSISSGVRSAAVHEFQENPSRMLFVGNPAAAGSGITLHAAYDAVYLSYSNQAAHYLQSLDRIHRRGQVSDEVNYHLLVCAGTIEETEIVRLRGKEVRQHDLLRDQVAFPSTLDEALAELGGHA